MWIRGSPTWWVARFVPALIFAPVAAYFMFEELATIGRVGQGIDFGVQFLVAVLVIGGIAFQLAVYRLYPSLRSLGISAGGLTLDYGVTKESYPWSELHDVTRISAHVYAPGETHYSTRTRIHVGEDLWRVTVVLSQSQGDRLAHQLRIA